MPQSSSAEPIQGYAARTTYPVAAAAHPNTTGLPDQLKAGVENLSGYSLDDVQVHYNSNKPAQLQAHAYAQGTDIHLAPGQEQHLPHEAWHVVQQKQGRVRPTMQVNGVGVNDNAGLEREADFSGARANHTSNLQQYESNQLKNYLPLNTAAQRVIAKDANTFVSTSDKTTVIDANNAAITVAATKDETFGGHAEIYLELFENGVPVEYSLDMFGANQGRVMVRMKRYSMGEMNSRAKGGFTTYPITTQQADQALIAASELKINAENETLKYTYYIPKFWNAVSTNGVSYMNCADFVAAVMGAAGISASSGLLSRPMGVANNMVI